MKLEGDIDELIFDYLEGNLGKEEQEAFELLKEENETFSHHVRLWQNAYVSEPLPPTDDLEAKCFINHNPGTGLSNKTGLLASLVALMLLMPSSRSEVAVKIDAPILVSAQTQKAEVQDAAQARAAIVIPALAIVEKKIEEEQEVGVTEYKVPVIEHEVPLQQESSTAVNEPATDSPALDLQIDIPVTNPPVTFKPIEVRLSKRTIPMFTDRELAKMKRRHQQHVNKFTPGNVPYVVPLSTQNF